MRRVWVTANGTRVPLESMTDDHLDNAIELCRATLMDAQWHECEAFDFWEAPIDQHFVRSWILALYKERKRRRLAGPALRIERARKAFG
jgi:hypothetical protein